MPFTKYTNADPAQAPATLDASMSADALAQSLAGEPYLARRAQHLDALVALNSADAVAALRALLHHADPAVRAAGVEGLRRTDSALSRPALQALLDHASPDIRIRALDAIERVPDAEIEGWLIALLDREPCDNVCGVVLDLLMEVGSTAALPAIRAARLRFATTPFIVFAADLAAAQVLES